MAMPVEERVARIAKLVADVDALAVILPKAFERCRLETVRTMAKGIAEQSQIVRLSINLHRSPAEVLETVEALRASLGRLRLMSSRIRVEQGTLLSIMLMEKFAGLLSADLDAWRAKQDAALSPD
jgi:hypothetical protein